MEFNSKSSVHIAAYIYLKMPVIISSKLSRNQRIRRRKLL